ncbi:peptidase M15 [Mycobacterium sp. EPa45]|nr:M15 family metallopeptidase [Mycobacterium sp. EPa45]AKK30389.1 peptidase M15 [Mycobacterium sp. EPa45]
MRRAGVLLAVAAAVLVQCSPAPDRPPGASSSVTTTITPAALVSPVTAAELGASWRPGCPVAPEQLRRVEVDYLGLDGQTHRGALVVHEQVVADIVAIFADLRRKAYPIAKMQTPDHYPGAADELSMEDNNTSAFNCRPLPGSTSWSLHAYGRAIDVNPLLNPYIDRSGDLEPTTAGRYLDRRRSDPGILHAGDPAVRAFTDRGWTWGGSWHNPIDYQHFEHR